MNITQNCPSAEQSHHFWRDQSCLFPTTSSICSLYNQHVSVSTLFCVSADLLIASSPSLNRSHDEVRQWDCCIVCVLWFVDPSDWCCEMWCNKSFRPIWVKGKACAHVCGFVCVCECVPSVPARLLESDKKADWTRLKYEYRAGERERKEKRAKRRGKEWRILWTEGDRKQKEGVKWRLKRHFRRARPHGKHPLWRTSVPLWKPFPRTNVHKILLIATFYRFTFPCCWFPQLPPIYCRVCVYALVWWLKLGAGSAQGRRAPTESWLHCHGNWVRLSISLIPCLRQIEWRPVWYESLQ